ncbi:hypothetical protein CYMTET_34947, partial [Cymbomonas tetramitiformis]
PSIILANELFDALPVHQFQACPRMHLLAPIAAAPWRRALRASRSRCFCPAARAGASYPWRCCGRKGWRFLPLAMLWPLFVFRPARRNGTRHPVSGIGNGKGPQGLVKKTERGWCERLVTLADRSSSEHFQLMLSPGETLASRLLVEHRLKYATQGEKEKLEVLEVSSQAMALAQEIAVRVGTHGGGALLVDYGHDRAFGNSLQAIRDHRFVDLLDQPGMSDLSAYVDFAALRHCCSLAAGTS